MSGLLDWTGRPLGVSSRFAHGADRSPYRGVNFPTRYSDIEDLIPAGDRQRLAALSRRMFTNMGVPKAAILQKASYSIGEAWLPVYGGTDAAGKAAEEWLRDAWYPQADVRGGVFDWWQLLHLVSVAMDRDGEAFVLLTRDRDGFPKAQMISAHRVHSDEEGKSGAEERRVESGTYKGMRIRDGVIYNRSGAAVAYRVNTGEGPDRTKKDISAGQLIHVFDPEYAEGGRGYPAFTHALEDLKHMLQSTEYERVAQLMISSIGLVEHNELGGPDFDDPAHTVSADSTSGTGISHETYDGGTIRYFKANSGGKLETITHDRPGEVWDNFHDRLTRAAVAGADWSYSLAWKPAGQGTAERGEIEKARRAVMKRQRRLDYLAKRLVTYAVAVESGESRGEIAMPETMRWSFTRPPRLSVDDGREAKRLQEGYRLGEVNMTELQAFKGRTAMQHWTERAEEAAQRKLAKAAAEEKYGVQIEDREMVMWTPNEMPEPEAEQ